MEIELQDGQKMFTNSQLQERIGKIFQINMTCT